MSYRLINANNITFNSDGFITAENIEKMPCIYADLPNGMDGQHYVLEQQSMLDRIRAEIDRARFIDKDTRHCRNALASGLEVALQIIDKYKAESEEENGKENN